MGQGICVCVCVHSLYQISVPRTTSVNWTVLHLQETEGKQKICVTNRYEICNWLVKNCFHIPVYTRSVIICWLSCCVSIRRAYTNLHVSHTCAFRFVLRDNPALPLPTAYLNAGLRAGNQSGMSCDPAGHDPSFV